MQFGFLGVGALSHPMLQNFLADGHEVTVWNRTRSAADDLAGAGATVVDHAAEAVTPGGVLMSCLADDDALRDVFGDRELFKKLGNGGVHVSMSTCSPVITDELCDRLEEVGGQHVTCPVLGRPDFVARRAHRFAVSGDPAAIARVQGALAGVSQEIFQFGEEAHGAIVAKLCTNYLIASSVEVMAEALSVAVAADTDAEALRKMWNATYFPGVVHETYSRQILDKAFDPLFALKLMLKDVGLFNDAADREGVTVPVAATLEARYETAMDVGLGDKDFTAVSQLAWNDVDD